MERAHRQTPWDPSRTVVDDSNEHGRCYCTPLRPCSGFPSGSDVLRDGLGEGPVGVHDAPVAVDEAVAVGGVPCAELDLVAAVVQDVGVEVVAQDGEVLAVADRTCSRTGSK